MMKGQKKRTSLSIEVLRLIAIFGIVVFHTGRGTAREIGYSGLPFFLIITGYFIGRSSQSASAAIPKRFHRLIRPFLTWSLVYGIVSIAFNALAHRPLFSGFGPMMVLSGTYIHLWFLPFVFLAGHALYLLNSMKLSTAFHAVLLVIIPSCTLVSAVLLRNGPYPAPIGEWLYSTPAILFGWYFGRLVFENDRFLQIAAAVLFLSVIFTLDIFGLDALSMSYTLGLLAFYACMILPIDSTVRVPCDLSFRIYLLHPLVGMTLRSLFHEPGTVIYSLCVFAVSAGGSMILCREFWMHIQRLNGRIRIKNV